MNQASPLSLSRSATTPDSFVQMAETWYVPGADPGFSKRGAGTCLGRLMSCGGLGWKSQSVSPPTRSVKALKKLHLIRLCKCYFELGPSSK